MGIRDVRLADRTFVELQQKMELLKDSLDSNTQQIEKVNDRVEKVQQKEEQQKHKDWAKVEDITEEDRYPMIKTSKPGIHIETQLLMKKLDII